MQAPKAKKVPKELNIHGDTRVDDYFWLNEREDQEVLDYLNAENAYTKDVLKPTEKLQNDLYEEMVGRIKKDDASVPFRKSGYWYYTRFEETGEYPIYCRKQGEGKLEDAGAEEIVFNVNEMAKEHAYYQLGSYTVSPNNELCVYAEDTVSRRIYNLYLKNLKTGEKLEMEIKGTTGGATWAADNQTIFYTLKDETTLRSYKIMSYNILTKEHTERYIETDDT
ncbi:MAG: oligopeptidase B, partial [Bacteroidia bacterium]